METKKRATKGITLIALVVTIVVLLILAGVSINLVIGNNGIITKAGDARDANKYATIKDEYELYKSNQYIESVTGGSGGKTFPEFLADLKNRGILTDEDIAQINSENKLTIGDKYEISFAKTLYDEVTDPNGSIKVGDYVTYTPDSTKSYPSPASENGWADQTYTVDTNTQWRVLGTEGNQVLLISADPIKKNMDESSENSWDKDPYLYMKGANSYVNCVKMLNNISGKYSTSLGKARSITADDINNILGVTVASDKVYYTSDSTQTNIDVSMNTEDWLGLGSTYIYKSTDYSPESYINGKTNATEGESVTQNGYFYDCTSKMNETIGKTTLGELLFEGTTETYNLSKSYWLASNRTFCNLSNAYFGPGLVDSGCVGAGSGMFVSNGYWIALKSAVRPVVCLNPDITVNQLHVIDGELETWTYDNSFWMEGGITTGEAGNHGN